MEELDNVLIDLLCNAYKKIIYSEEKILKDMIGDSLSLKEFHTLDVVYDNSKNKTNTASNIARNLGITLGTLTINIDRLTAKGYVHKVKNDKDKRITFIELTEKGEQIRAKHEIIRRKLVTEATTHLSTSEKVALTNAMNKLEF